MNSERQSNPIDRPIFCLTGCTAVGKTELALAWAERFGAEVVNCDSLLFYRGMDIGTAKPGHEERERVRHHLIDILDPSGRMDVGVYQELALDTIRAIHSRGKEVLVTGGSGFYLKAFFQPVVDGLEVGDASRAEAERLMAEGLEVAVAALRRLNPDGLDGLDADNPRRVAKALERCLETGKTVRQLKQAFEAQSHPLLEAEKRLCILEREKDALNERIATRVGLMLEEGLIEEVSRLLEQGILENPSACNAIGYRETIAYLKGEYTKGELCERIATNTRRLAKKQRTWFRGQFPDMGQRIHLGDGVEPKLGELFSSR